MYELTDRLAKDLEGLSDRPKESYRNLKSAIAKQSMQARVEAGECPGSAPVGYENVIIGNRRTVAMHPVVGPLIAEAFRLAGQRKSSIRKILEELRPKGLIGKYGQPMSVASLQVVLANPFYAGLIRLGGRLYPGSHTPLVSKSLFRRVRQNICRRRNS